MALISIVMGLTTTDIAEAFSTVLSGCKDVYVDIGDGKLHQVKRFGAVKLTGRKS